MLTIILEKIRTYPDREHFENEINVKSAKEPVQQLIVTQMSLKIIEDRIKNHEYKVSEAFVHDIKQLEHNWNVVDRTKAKSLKTIIKYVNAEINELEACVYCYQEPFVNVDWFVQPCKRTHLLIWAKLKGVRG
jgi:Bromodomain